jgi:hypothetical protein
MAAQHGFDKSEAPHAIGQAGHTRRLLSARLRIANMVGKVALDLRKGFEIAVLRRNCIRLL